MVLKPPQSGRMSRSLRLGRAPGFPRLGNSVDTSSVVSVSSADYSVEVSSVGNCVDSSVGHGVKIVSVR